MAKSKSELADDLAIELAASLNKKFKNTGYQTAFFLDGDTKAPTEVNGWVKSGSSMLDIAISNKKDGGFPVGRISEITGLEASGKSLLAAHALANTQQQGGLAVYIDTENAVSREFLEAIGLDLNKMLYVPLETIEDIFEAIESIVESVRKSNKDARCLSNTERQMACLNIISLNFPLVYHFEYTLIPYTFHTLQ